MRKRWHKEEKAAEVTEADEEQRGEGVLTSLNNLIIETGGTEEGPEEALQAALGGDKGDGSRGEQGEGGGV